MTQSFIDSFAPNPAAVANGKKLVQKGNFLKLNISPDGTLIFGECAGSGKTPYQCSIDLKDEAKPVARCSCPSRQFPCKHCVGLMLAKAGGAVFAQGDIPPDVAEKRAKLEKKAEKTASGETEPKTAAQDTPQKAAARQAAQHKKIDMQLQGLTVAGQLLGSMVQMGLGAFDARLRKSLADQVKALGNYYIPGVQKAFNDLLLCLSGTDQGRFVRGIDSLTYLHALIGRGQEYLLKKRESGAPDVSTNIEELLGHAWKLEQLRELDCCQADAQLLQLSFHSYSDHAEEIQEGIWIDLASGRLFKTHNYRPHRAAKYIKAEDTVFDLVTTPELMIYPGNLNPRVRWNESVFSPPQETHFAAARAFAARDYATVIKAVKNQLKSPLADKNPVALLYAAEIGIISGESGGCAAIRDAAGIPILLQDSGYAQTGTVATLTGPLAGARDAALLVLFTHDLSTGQLTAMPLSLLADDRAIRLLY